MGRTDLPGLQPAAATAAQPAPEARHLRRQLLALAGALIGLSGLLVVVLLAQQSTQALESSQRLNESLARVVEAQAGSAMQALDQHLRLTAQGLALLAAAGNLNETSARAAARTGRRAAFCALDLGARRAGPCGACARGQRRRSAAG